MEIAHPKEAADKEEATYKDGKEHNLESDWHAKHATRRRANGAKRERRNCKSLKRSAVASSRAIKSASIAGRAVVV